MNVSKKTRLLEAFQRGVNLTPAQITARYGIANPSATVSDLRMEGYAIYANQRRGENGTYTSYRLGTPTRRVVAAGYRALANEA